MTDETKYKKYTIQARHGIKGEAFFESLIADYSLPHRISGSKDIGVDFICEWNFDDKPSGVLYIVQVKTLESKSIRGRTKGTRNSLNRLMGYNLTNSHLKIDDPTLDYWRGFGIPAYLFLVLLDSDASPRECYYRRYTHLLTEVKETYDEDISSEYYRVDDGGRFLAFQDSVVHAGGFARDLFIDYVRCQYSKGSITYIDPKKLGLDEFQENAIFEDLLGIYRNSIIPTYQILHQYFNSRSNNDT